MATTKSRQTKSRAELPRYADYGAISLSHDQLRRIFKHGYKSHPIADGSRSGTVRIARLNDGSWWVEKRGETIFWAHRWFLLPEVVGERAAKIDAYVSSL